MRPDQPLAVGKDIVFFLDNVVRREPAAALADGETAAGQVEADADVLRGADAGIEANIVDADVVMIDGRGAAGEEKFGVVDERLDVQVLVR
jgi:hypothetical protein